jgi:predicted metal-dependent phosphoesterase TrpH
MSFRADLHCHSDCSDGLLSPKELLYLASESKLSGLSITDHDTIKGYSKELFDVSDKLQIKLLTGVEISSSMDKETVHVLGYGFDYTSEVLKSFLKKLQIRRYNRNIAILKKLSDYNIKITEKELYESYKSSEAIGRPHIAQLMVKKGYVSHFKEAFNEYLKDGGKCYVFGEKFSVEEAIEKLHEVKAIAVLAHPEQIGNVRILKKILDLPFDGVEAYYGKLLPSKEKRWVRIANSKGWITTGGSDFHGEIKPFISLGCSWVPEDIFEKLYSRSHFSR